MSRAARWLISVSALLLLGSALTSSASGYSGAAVAGVAIGGGLGLLLALQLTRKLHQREAELRVILNTARDAVVSIDAAGIIRFFNPAAEEIFGYAAAEVVGHNVTLLMPSPYKESHDQYLHSYHTTKQAKAIGRVRRVHGQRKSGEVFPVEISIGEARAGNAVVYTSIIRDVEAVERRYRALFETSGSAIVLLSSDIEIRDANAELERISGYRADQLRGRTYLEALAPERERQRVVRELEQVLDGGITENFESPIVTAEGGERFLLWNARRVEQSGETGIIAVGIDVTERRRQHLRLTQAEKLSSIGLLAAGVAHEINNPLAGVLACIQALHQGEVPEHRRDEYFSTARDGLVRIQQIVRDLLEYARRRPAQPSEVEVRDVLGACHRLIAPALNKKGLRLVKHLVPEDLSVVVDRSQMIQALMNILLNAVHASPSAGEVRVEAQRQGGSVILRVIDRGPGISETDLPRVCDPFFTTKEEGEGTGLGLAVTLGIVEAHGGQLDIESGPGRGTRVALRLPALESHAQDPAG